MIEMIFTIVYVMFAIAGFAILFLLAAAGLMLLDDI